MKKFVTAAVAAVIATTSLGLAATGASAQSHNSNGRGPDRHEQVQDRRDDRREHRQDARDDRREYRQDQRAYGRYQNA